jgi:hypothetical protein
VWFVLRLVVGLLLPRSVQSSEGAVCGHSVTHEYESLGLTSHEYEYEYEYECPSDALTPGKE